MPYSQEEYDITRARFEALPENVGIAILGYGTFVKQDVLTHIDAKDVIGDILVKLQMNYLRTLKTIK